MKARVSRQADANIPMLDNPNPVPAHDLSQFIAAGLAASGVDHSNRQIPVRTSPKAASLQTAGLVILGDVARVSDTDPARAGLTL